MLCSRLGAASRPHHDRSAQFCASAAWPEARGSPPSLQLVSTDFRTSEKTAWLDFCNFLTFPLQVDEHVNFREYRAYEGELPSAMDECDAYLVTGSSYRFEIFSISSNLHAAFLALCSVYDNQPWIAKLRPFLQRLVLNTDPNAPRMLAGEQAALSALHY